MSSRDCRRSAAHSGGRFFLFGAVELEALAGDALFNAASAEVVRRLLVRADHADRVPRPELRRQLLAAGIGGERAELVIGLRLEHEQTHDRASLPLKNKATALAKRRLRYGQTL